MSEAGIDTDAYTFYKTESRPALQLVSRVIVATELEHPMDFNDLSGDDQIPFGD